MAGSRLQVQLARDSFNTPWGFRLQGGVDLNQPLQVQRVFSNSPAEGELQRGDFILSINNSDTSVMPHKLAQDLIVNAGGQVKLTINRPPAGTVVAPLSPPAPQPRAPSLSQPPSRPAYPGGAPGHTPTKISLNKLGGGGAAMGTDYGPNRHKYSNNVGWIPACSVDSPKGKPNAAGVASNLENITLSPQPAQQAPVYQPPPPQPVYQPPQQPAYQPPQQPAYMAPPQRQDDPRQYTPTQMLLDQQRMEQEQQEREFLMRTQQAPLPRSGVSGPLGGDSRYSDLGIDYRSPNQRGWKPAPKVSAPRPKPQPYVQDPPAWQRPPQVDESDGNPAWANTLRSSGPKPWEKDQYNLAQQDAGRSVQPQQYAPPPPQPRPAPPAPVQAPQPAPMSPRNVAVAPASPHVMSPPQMLSPNSQLTRHPDDPMAILPMPGSENYVDSIRRDPPKVVHLQYNSPMGLYSEQNMEETLAGQTAAAMEQQAHPPPMSPDTRDWSKSAVLQFIEAENSRKKPAAPAPTGPKPASHHTQQYLMTADDLGATDF